MELGPLLSRGDSAGEGDDGGAGAGVQVLGAYGESERGRFPGGALFCGTSGVCLAEQVFAGYEIVAVDAVRGEEITRIGLRPGSLCGSRRQKKWVTWRRVDRTLPKKYINSCADEQILFIGSSQESKLVGAVEKLRRFATITVPYCFDPLLFLKFAGLAEERFLNGLEENGLSRLHFGPEC